MINSRLEFYIGDGVYVSTDGNAVKLRAPRDLGSDHYIFLERDQLEILFEYVNRVMDKAP